MTRLEALKALLAKADAQGLPITPLVSRYPEPDRAILGRWTWYYMAIPSIVGTVVTKEYE